jgi:polyvinyl alcohol dehydrogenase (cytochrome)
MCHDDDVKDASFSPDGRKIVTVSEVILATTPADEMRLWDVDTAREFETVNTVPARGGSLNGPGATIVGGMLFVSSGYGSLGFMPGNVLLAFSIDGK